MSEQDSTSIGGNAIHPDPHPLAGAMVTLDLGHGPVEFHIEDWLDRVSGQSWMVATGNPTAIKYALRSGFAGLPYDNEVLYGKVGGLGHIVHVSEIPEAAQASATAVSR